MDQSILIAIISGVSVLSGVVISQAISLLISFLDKKHQKRILLRQKYEEMMFYFSDSLEWLQTLHSSQSRSSIFALAQPKQSRKVLSLCLLYFPDLSKKANQYIYSQVQYFEFVATTFDPDKPFNAGGQALVHPEGKNLLDNLMNKKTGLENLIVNNVSIYIKA